MNLTKVLIVGGYGTVGSQIAKILHDRHPTLELLLGGRSAGKSLPFASTRLKPFLLDISKSDPLAHAPDDLTLIISAVNDPDDTLLLAAVRRQIPLIDVTRWTERFTRSIERLKNENIGSPVILASGWMGGTVALLASIHTASLLDVQIHLHALYSLQDKAGPDSTDYMDRMTIPFSVTTPTGVKEVTPLSDPEPVTFPNGYHTKCYRLDTPDHTTLVKAQNVTAADFRIAFDNKLSTFALVSLVKSRIWNLLSKSTRQKILYNPGAGSPHHVVIQINGRNQHSMNVKRQVEITDPKGQTHLTAMGAAIFAHQIILQNENSTVTPGVLFPEDFGHFEMTADDILQFYRSEGVQIVIHDETKKSRAV
ncbi:saccharopine dehydrogenase [Brevibacillus porteri]|uniref:saccharopine dehydrogenase n=1 Tax=Brevibacillus porteri TaxID=2126350 RepID=UPI0036314C07